MRLISHIPNTITSLNLLCGVYGVVVSLTMGRLDIAFYLMLAAAVLDFFDGLTARLLKAYSNIGKELDSLADLVSFGVLPSVMLFCIIRNTTDLEVFAPVVLLMSVFAALRLAKFNVDERQHDSFIGLPSPASAMIAGSYSYYIYMTYSSGQMLAPWLGNFWITIAIALILSLLMVSEIPMFSMKFGKGKDEDFQTKIQRIAFLSISAILCIIVLVLGMNWSIIILSAFIVYILMNLVFYFLKLFRK